MAVGCRTGNTQSAPWTSARQTPRGRNQTSHRSRMQQRRGRLPVMFAAMHLACYHATTTIVTRVSRDDNCHHVISVVDAFPVAISF